MAAWRSALVRVVSPKDIEAVLKKLLECAKAGEPWAIRELLDRCLGKPRPEAERPAGPEQPDKVRVNVDLGTILTDRMARLSELPPAPGLRSLPDLRSQDGQGR